MTRQVAVVNLSNWDHEDYVVRNEDHSGEIIETRIPPGEAVFLANPGYQPESERVVTLVTVEDEQIKSFNTPDGSKQLYPSMFVTRPSVHVASGTGFLIDFEVANVSHVLAICQEALAQQAAEKVADQAIHQHVRAIDHSGPGPQ